MKKKWISLFIALILIFTNLQGFIPSEENRNIYDKEENNENVNNPVDLNKPILLSDSRDAGKQRDNSNTLYDENWLKTQLFEMNPGEVRLTRKVDLVDGKVNTWKVTLGIYEKDIKENVDIILVIDRSSSMDDNGRLESAKRAAKSFVDTLLTEENDNIRIGVVAFSGNRAHSIENTYIISELRDYKSKEQLKSNIDEITALGGTFTQAGIREAENMLSNSNADKKHIVLLSDGHPTYSYAIQNMYIDNYLQEFELGYETNSNVPEYAYNYNNRVGIGSELRFRYEGGFFIPGKYYNHGNQAIAEANIARNKGFTLWSVGLDVDEEGREILEQVGNYFDANPENLEKVYDSIAEQIGKTINEGKVDNNLGSGFSIAQNASEIKTSGSGSANLNSGIINWNVGTLNTYLNLNDEGYKDIRFAELSYYIEINDDILNNLPNSDGSYTSQIDDVYLNYKDGYGNNKRLNFPSISVTPLIYEIEKVLLDKNGNVKDSNENFTINIKGPGNENENKFSYKLTTKNGKVTKRITDLRDIGKYTFEEVDNNGYLVKYYLDGKEVSNNKEFNINQSSKPFHIKVENKEKEATIVIDKTLEKLDLIRSDLKNPTFNFKLTGPNGYSTTFNLSEEDGWSKTFEGLESGSYTIYELNNDGYRTSIKIDDNNERVTNSTQINVNKGQTVNVHFYNEYVKTDLFLYKVNGETYDPLEGAEFTLYEADEEYNKGKKYGESQVSDEYGQVTFKDLLEGKYILEETKAPKGFVKDQEYYKVEVNQGSFDVFDKDGEYVGDAKETIIENNPGKELPLTGGNGSRIYYVIGLSLICLAFVIYKKQVSRIYK